MMENVFTVQNEELYINGTKVLKGYESFSGWYWFATEQVEEGILYGLVQGFEEEWGDFSEEELNELIKTGKVWEIPKKNLPFSGRQMSSTD